MKIICISDLHNQIKHLTLPSADLLVIAGDITNRGRPEEFVQFNKDLFDIKDRYRLGILAIPGNHDWLCEKDWPRAKELLSNVKYLIHHEPITIEGVKFFGSGYTPEFGGWAFNVPRGKELAAKWAQIPDDTDVLITHGPPYGILDEADLFSGPLGCKDLLDVVMKVKPRYHVFGHIHGSGTNTRTIAGTTFINAAICDEHYRPINPPIEFEV